MPEMLKNWLRGARDVLSSIANGGGEVRRLLEDYQARTSKKPLGTSAHTGTELGWGILGTGAIAKKFARGISESRTGRLAAVGSRRSTGAEEFAATYPARAHGAYEALLADPEVQVVYISTPHPFHAEWAIKAAEAGKHVLCEKPLTMNAAEALKVVAAARANSVFLMEAFMYRCHPQSGLIRDMVCCKAIGEVRLIQASFSFRAPDHPESRLLSRALGGGGILDVGCYCVSMARMIAGAVNGAAFADPLDVSGSGRIGAESGVDEYAVASLRFENGVLAQLAAGVRLDLENSVSIWGTEGHIHIPRPWLAHPDPGTSTFYVQRSAKTRREKFAIHSDRSAYALEVDHVADHLAAGQSTAISWEDSVGNMRTLDRWRDAIGITRDLL